MFESYLLNPGAIKAFIENETQSAVDESLVSAELDAALAGKDIRKVDAAKVLASIVTKLTSTTATFRKPGSSLQLEQQFFTLLHGHGGTSVLRGRKLPPAPHL